MPAKRSTPIHHSIKTTLGYDASDKDVDVVADWKQRTSRVCKPCWELKYCPFGPLVEQSPLLPSERGGMIQRINYLEKCLHDSTIGEVEHLSDERKKEYSKWLKDQDLLLHQAVNELRQMR